MFKKSLLCVLVLAIMLNMCACGMQGGVILGDNAAKNELTDETMGFVNAYALKVRKEPSVDAEVVALLKEEQEVHILAERDDFYQVSIRIQSETGESDEILEGYVKKEYINVN